MPLHMNIQLENLRAKSWKKNKIRDLPLRIFKEERKGSEMTDVNYDEFRIEKWLEERTNIFLHMHSMDLLYISKQ